MDNFHLAMLLSDWIIWFLVLIAIIFFMIARKNPRYREPFRYLLSQKLGMMAFVILSFYALAGLMDSVHFRVANQTKSVLDLVLQPLGQNDEKTYSSPFATHLYTQDVVTLPNGKEIRSFAELKYSNDRHEVHILALYGFFDGLFSFALIFSALIIILSYRHQQNPLLSISKIFRGKTQIAWREALITFAIIWFIICIISRLSHHFHLLGTDKIGQDVMYQAIKSIRTGLLIGILTTLFMLPFALIAGTLAGYFRGVTDDIIQYLYTTLSSIPGILLISASVLMLQIYIANHPSLFPTLAQRADARLLALCFILGITSWANLCRLLRGETLKLRSLEFVQAAQSLGVKHSKIIFRHILPNVMHIILITLVLDFSGLVLAEAVLSYVGVGVDPTTLSWGNMINSSRLELARDPIVWWPLLAALIFMFLLVLSSNIFADAVRDALDPHLKNG